MTGMNSRGGSSMRFFVDIARDRQYLIDFCEEHPAVDFEILQNIINIHNKATLGLIVLTLPIIRMYV